MQPADHHSRTQLLTFSLRTIIVAGAAIMAFISIQGLASDANPEYLRLKAAAKKSYEAGNLFATLQLLEKAKTVLDSNPGASPLDQEAVLYDLAGATLEYADTMTDSTQRANLADKSIKLWTDYLAWFRSLTPAGRSVIEGNAQSLRIQTAMDRLGSAFVTRGDSKSYSIRDLFAVYADLDYTYLNSASVKRWRALLQRCPSWKPLPTDDLLPLDSLKFSGDNAVCKEPWREFSNFVEYWVVKQQLDPDKRKYFEQWHKDLEKSLGTS